MRTRIAVSILVASLLVAIGLAQSNPGEIRGVVTDVAGAALPGVQVTLTGPDKRSAVTDPRGEFAFRNLRPGPYELRLELAGFKTSRRKWAYQPVPNAERTRRATAL